MHSYHIKATHPRYSPQMFKFLKYVQTAKQSVGLIYSHVNPIVLLVVLGPFRTMVNKIYVYLLKSHQSGFAFLDEKTAGKFANSNGVGNKQLKRGTRAILLKVISIILIIIGAFVIFLVASWVTLNTTLSNLRSRQFDLGTFEEKVVYKQRVLKSMRFSDLHLDISYKYKQLCAEKHGRFQFNFMRCYFLTRHKEYVNRTIGFLISFFC